MIILRIFNIPLKLEYEDPEYPICEEENQTIAHLKHS